jgi:hypothetical protein
MLRRFTILLVILALLPILSVAQQKALLKPGGKTVYLNSNQDPKEVFEVSVNKYHSKTLSKSNPMSVNGKIDTLSNNDLASGTYTSTFGAFGQDVLVGWFQAPADLKILSVGYDCGDNPGVVAGELKLYKLGNGWTAAKLKSITSAKSLGYWIAKGNGFNDIAPFEDEATEPKTWIAHSADALTPFVEDIWSDAGTGAPTTPEYDNNTSTYQWVSMDLLGFQPEVKGGDVFAIVLKNTDTQFDVNRFGIMSNVDVKYGIFKYYANGRTSGDTSTAGWWKREYLFNIAAAVEITGDTPPSVTGITNIQGTLSTDPIEISATLTDDNPGGGPAGIKEAFLVYHTDANTTDVEVPMAVKSGDVWAGSIPGQTPGTKVTYFVKAADMNNNITVSQRTYTYVIFAPTPGVNTLLVFNGLSYDGNQDNVNEYPQNWIFGVNADGANPEFYKFKKDVWAYGPLSAQLVNSYDNVLEIAGSPNGPKTYNNDVIKTWLEGNASRNYFLAGQEWLGAGNSYTDLDFAAGSFEYDILGVTHSYNDVSYDGTSGQNIASKLTATDGSVITGPMLTKFTALATDSLCYDPYYEIGTAWANWIDGFDVVDGQAVDLKVETRGVVGAPDVRTLNCATHRTLTAGNKVVFFSYDPLAVNTAPKYYWFGFDISSPQIQVLNWFGIQTSVERMINNKPDKFELSQNYPNPFNPNTTISYAVPEVSKVTLKIYDMLGREVITLVDGTKNTGTYEVSFDASNLTSGLYIYTLTTGNFSASKKMMLLK